MDISPTGHWLATPASKPQSTDSSFIDPEEGWYASIPQTPTPIISSSHQRSPFNFTPKLDAPTRKAPPIPTFRRNSSSTSDSIDDSTTTTQSLPILRGTRRLSPSLPILQSTNSNPVTAPTSTKTKRKIFSLKRFKRKKPTKLAEEVSFRCLRSESTSLGAP